MIANLRRIWIWKSIHLTRSTWQGKPIYQQACISNALMLFTFFLCRTTLECSILVSVNIFHRLGCNLWGFEGKTIREVSVLRTTNKPFIWSIAPVWAIKYIQKNQNGGWKGCKPVRYIRKIVLFIVDKRVAFACPTGKLAFGYGGSYLFTTCIEIR